MTSLVNNKSFLIGNNKFETDIYFSRLIYDGDLNFEHRTRPELIKNEQKTANKGAL
jgi:hypothetical protein